jgi:monoamine oxidase
LQGLLSLAQRVKTFQTVDSMEKRILYDVAVIGAGMCGIIAARDLVRAGKSVIIVEAKEKAGGRMKTVVNEEDGTILEFGATWIGPGQENMINLCVELGIPTFPQPCAGINLQKVQGEAGEYSGSVPPLPLLALLDLQQSILRTDYQANRLNQLTLEEKIILDNMTTTEYIDSLMYTKAGKSFYAAMARSLSCVEASNISAYVWLESTQGNLLGAVEIENGAQQDRISGGVCQIPEKILSSIKDSVDVRFSCPIRKVETLENGMIQGETYQRSFNAIDESTREVIFTAKSCIIAVPPLVTSKIEFSPPLPESQVKYLKDFQPGCVTKVVVRYSRPWWKEKGYSGCYMSDESLINYMCDHSHVATNTEDVNNPQNFYALVCFILTKWQKEWNGNSAEERKKLVCEELYDIFKLQEAMEPTNYYEHNWNNEEFSLGCYSDISNVGFISRHGLVHAFKGGENKNIFFTCSEYAEKYAGYMEGAIIAGQKAAAHLLEQLNH